MQQGNDIIEHYKGLISSLLIEQETQMTQHVTVVAQQDADDRAMHFCSRIGQCDD